MKENQKEVIEETEVEQGDTAIDRHYENLAASENILTEALGEMEANGTQTIDVYVTTGFWQEHGTTVAKASAGTAAIAAAFTGGFFTGKHVEKKKRQMFMSEVEKQCALITAESEGLATIPWNGEELSTAEHKVEDTTELKEVISKNFLKDSKVKGEERTEWLNLMVTLTTLGVYAKTKQIITRNEIVIDEENMKADE